MQEINLGNFLFVAQLENSSEHTLRTAARNRSCQKNPTIVFPMEISMFTESAFMICSSTGERRAASGERRASGEWRAAILDP